MTVLLWIICMIVWIINLTKWDGKCKCDRENCKVCPYDGDCPHQKGGRR